MRAGLAQLGERETEDIFESVLKVPSSILGAGSYFLFVYQLSSKNQLFSGMSECISNADVLNNDHDVL